MLRDNSEKYDKFQMTLSLLNTWAIQTANGMKYLTEKNIIHGDLAVRNLLLKELKNIKITDFGLARQLKNYAIYQKTQQVKQQLSTEFVLAIKS